MHEYSHEEKELLRRIARGDEAAFRIIFDLYRQRLLVFAWHISHSVVEAEEIVQDIFMKLWENRKAIAEVEYPRKYIYTMARNRAVDQLCKIARDQKLRTAAWVNLSQDHRNLTEELLNEKESRELISEAVASLTEKKQAIFRLSRQEGLSHQEIAREMSLSVQTVKNILTEILRHIKAHLQQHSELLAIAFWIQAGYDIF